MWLFLMFGDCEEITMVVRVNKNIHGKLQSTIE
jgi:hypothetical protein